jgi:hypothetical protein
MAQRREIPEEKGDQHKLLKANPAVDPASNISPGVVEIQISPKRLVKQCLWIITGLVILSTLGQISRHILGRSRLFGLIDLFYVDAEGNIPTAYSSMVWVLCSLSCLVIAERKKQEGDRAFKYWRGFTLTFAFLALDELASIHELFSELRNVLDVGGVFYFAWIIPGAIFFLIFALSCFKFVKTLPPKTRTLLILSGGIFVTGAIGIEMIGGWYTELYGNQADFTYSLITTAEEILEMLSVLMLLYALLTYMGEHTQACRVRVLNK